MLIDNFEHFTFSCLNSSLGMIEKFIRKKFSEKEKYSFHKKQEFVFDLYENAPRKGGSHFPKAYFFVPLLKEDVVIMTSNYSDGWSTLVNYTSAQLSIKAYKFSISSLAREEPRNAFSCVENGNEVRTVYAMKDGKKWVFYEGGEVQPFEDESNYKKRMIKKRLDEKILIEYCKKLGLDISNHEFWTSREVFKIERIEW